MTVRQLCNSNSQQQLGRQFTSYQDIQIHSFNPLKFGLRRASLPALGTPHICCFENPDHLLSLYTPGEVTSSNPHVISLFYLHMSLQRLWANAFAHVCICICIYIHICICIFIHISMCLCLGMYMPIYIHTHKHIHMHMIMHLYWYMHMLHTALACL